MLFKSATGYSNGKHKLKNRNLVQFRRSLSHVQLFETTWTAALQASLSITNPEFAQTHVHRVGYTIQPSHPLSSLFPWLQSFPASWSFPRSQIFASGGQSIRASASTSVLPMNIQDWVPLGLTGLIFLLSKELKSLFQHHSLKALILQCLAFFIVQLSYLYMIIGKNLALTIGTFVGKVMSLLFNMLSRLVITFLSRSKHP